jgi:hypothetical protein
LVKIAVKSSSPGHPKLPELAPPIDSLGPVPKAASPEDKIIPSVKVYSPLGSVKYPIPFTSLKFDPVE